MTIPHAVGLSSIIGRIIAALRRELGASQAAIAGRLRWDRSLLARIESGRNTATIDNIFELEVLLQGEGLLARHGDLVELSGRVAREAKRRGLVPVVGKSELQEGQESVEAATLDRIVARVVDDWLMDLEGERADEPPPRRKRRRR